MSPRPPLPPFTRETAIEKIRAAEDAWNSRDPERCAKAYTADSRWRNRSRFITGTAEIVAFLTAKWERENWLFDGDGLMAERHASINDVAIEESERKFHWDSSGPRPADHPGLTELGL
jgi:uncharacterized protein